MWGQRSEAWLYATCAFLIRHVIRGLRTKILPNLQTEEIKGLGRRANMSIEVMWRAFCACQYRHFHAVFPCLKKFPLDLSGS